MNRARKAENPLLSTFSLLDNGIIWIHYLKNVVSKTVLTNRMRGREHPHSWVERQQSLQYTDQLRERKNKTGRKVAGDGHGKFCWVFSCLVEISSCETKTQWKGCGSSICFNGRSISNSSSSSSSKVGSRVLQDLCLFAIPPDWYSMLFAENNVSRRDAFFTRRLSTSH